ncbi:NitT/TauT family transport system substrate-binding protein [Hydrogenispora ethanolica]|uniref:NitT/TauT family transport system substrate-binding protein n=1 Tax=Hydrogenispora ethanolica TaxID=1082276 RepID=A0A4R1RSE1_HYDET|nr:ABC transporter substrate-binding protein [Hydrogenispora ethanolica]TCL69398.1 NitT/TauT family transport system substrate-binding protein [Hydrogenispora ethanolica]
MKKVQLAVFAIFFLTLLGPGWGLALQKPSVKQPQISIAEQYGLAYAPLQIMKEMKFLEKKLPGLKVVWSQLGNTAAIREAMLAGKVDVGFMAIPPFLIGWNHGMPWKIACGLSESPVGLVTNQQEIRSLGDFTKTARIALPQPGSVQHILLAMACERQLGDAKKLDNQLVTLSHPDGMNALLAKKDITAHFTAPPYLFKELLHPDMHQIMDGTEAFGKEFTFIVGVCTEQFHQQSPRVFKAFLQALQETLRFMRENPEQTVSRLSAEYKIPAAELNQYFQEKGLKYNLEVKGVKEFAAFMKRQGYINKLPRKMSELYWETATYEK